MVMKFAICNELYQDWPHERAFAHAAQLGYGGIEIAPFTLGKCVSDVSQSQRRSLRELADSLEIEIIGLHWLLAKTNGLHLTTSDRQVRKKTADYLGELARLCGDLGGRVMVFGSPPQRNLLEGVTPQQGFDYAVEVFTEVAPVLEECGVTLALEPLGPEEGDFMLTAASAIEIAKAVDSSNVQLHLDVKAMSTEVKTIPSIIEDSKDWLVHFHANDPNRRGPGMGDVEFEPIFAALKRIQYNGWVSVEVFDYAPGVDALAGQSIRYMQELV
ncbi:sugar phosphate isomerase/epimerase [Mariniblastus sp.]|nr:sugar phosphate isomerase/epimerase [Mariniblastus sp.]MDA7906794.1 sugar phosphate isomerase/epimerase [Mariniblastus sp.]MDA7924379.1 sugar phosphate isomerase/epimerase [Mariniblastus sp.]MDC3223784.1 sugar phosphate isomerase/epimerase [Mariniblastus sp.]